MCDWQTERQNTATLWLSTSLVVTVTGVYWSKWWQLALQKGCKKVRFIDILSKNSTEVFFFGKAALKSKAGANLKHR